MTQFASPEENPLVHEAEEIIRHAFLVHEQKEISTEARDFALAYGALGAVSLAGGQFLSRLEVSRMSVATEFVSSFYGAVGVGCLALSGVFAAKALFTRHQGKYNK